MALCCRYINDYCVWIQQLDDATLDDVYSKLESGLDRLTKNSVMPGLYESEVNALRVSNDEISPEEAIAHVQEIREERPTDDGSSSDEETSSSSSSTTETTDEDESEVNQRELPQTKRDTSCNKPLVEVVESSTTGK